MLVKTLRICVILGFGIFAGIAPAQGAVIVTENLAGTTVTAFGGWFGQSVTTSGGGPWQNITFNFVKGDDTPAAEGGLYALSQTYAGTPNSLSASTPGFLAFTNTIVGGAWQFSGLTLNPNTQYFFFMDSALNSTLKFSLANPYSGGAGYNAVAGTTNYLPLSTFDLNFSLQGDVAAVPEPSSLALLGVGLSGIGLLRWRKRNARIEIAGDL